MNIFWYSNKRIWIIPWLVHDSILKQLHPRAHFDKADNHIHFIVFEINALASNANILTVLYNRESSIAYIHFEIDDASFVFIEFTIVLLVPAIINFASFAIDCIAAVVVEDLPV